MLRELSGPRRASSSSDVEKKDRVGRGHRPGVDGAGGDILTIEVSDHARQGGRLMLTGQLGDVMRESAQAAL